MVTKYQEIHLLVFRFQICFTASVNPSVNTPEFSNGFAVLIISSISSLEMNKVDPFPDLSASFPLILMYLLHSKVHLKLYCLLIQAIYL